MLLLAFVILLVVIVKLWSLLRSKLDRLPVSAIHQQAAGHGSRVFEFRKGFRVFRRVFGLKGLEF